MKLSKQIIAALLIVSMLLITMPVFAEDATGAEPTSSVRSWYNNALTLPTDGSSVTLKNTHCGSGTSAIAIVVDDASAEALGIDLSSITDSISTTANTDYAGIMLSGTMRLKEWAYTPGAAKNTDLESINSVLSDKEATYFKFENVEVSLVRLSGSKQLVLELPYSTLRKAATDVKVYAGDVDFSVLTEKTSVEQVEAPADSLTPAIFSGLSNAYLVDDLTAKAGEKYWRVKTVDMGSFPASTKIFATGTSNLQYFGTSYGHNSGDFSSQTLPDASNPITFWQGTSTGFSYKSGPFNIVIPKNSGTYYVYGLRKDCSNGGPRAARFNISGTKFLFSDMTGVTWASGDTEIWNGIDSWFWDKGEGTITLEAGKPYFFQNTGGANSRLAAVAFVPTSETEFTAPQTIIGENALKNADALNMCSDTDFTIDKVETYTVKVDGEDCTAKPYYWQVQTNNETGVYDFNANITGGVTRYATVAEVVAEVKGFSSPNIVNDYQIYVNGVREYAPELMLAMPGDVITVGTDAMSVDNFNPIYLNNNCFYRFMNSNPVIRMQIYEGYVPSYLFQPNTGATEDTVPFKDAKFAGYLTWNVDDEYKGQKVYFENAKPDTVSVAGGWGGSQSGSVLPEYATHFSGNSTNPTTIVVDTPDGEKRVMNPGQLVGNSAFYDINLYWVNSTVTDAVRVVEVAGDKYLRCDGLAKVRVIYVNYAEDDSVASTITECVDLLPKNAYKLDATKGDKAIIWKDTPYGGYSLVPICAPILLQ